MDNKEKYDNSFIEALSIDKKKLTKNLEYNSIEDGLKSKKQEDSFLDATLIDHKIDLYEKNITGGDHDPDLLQIWMILKLIREFRFRNEIASLEFVNRYTYDQEKGNTEKNMIIFYKIRNML